MAKSSERYRKVTDEPLVVDAALLGAPLASFRRRAFAYLLDLFLFGVIVGALFVGVSLAGIHRETPELFNHTLDLIKSGSDTQVIVPESPENMVSLGEIDLANLENDPEFVALNRQVDLDVFTLVSRRAPDVLPAEIIAAVESQDPDRLAEVIQGKQLVVAYKSGNTELTERDEAYELLLGSDVLFGDLANLFSWSAFFIGWFTLMVRVFGGRTPGKWLFGIRVVRLDGKRLSWWNAFSRAAGYSASTATALLGFLELFWDPNRQTLHDKIAATVVVNVRRLKKEGRRLPR